MKVTKKHIDTLGLDLSLLGFGCMRFPVTADGKIDEVRAEKMLDEAYEAGINYFDTAYPYHMGESEPFTGKVLSKYPRESYYLATKMPCWEVHVIEDAKRIFELQCSRIDKNYIDFYLVHALNSKRWHEMLELGVIKYLEDMKAEGKIKYLGFSFHDGYEAFEEIINYRNWDFCQIQLNYMDVDVQAGLKGYKLTEEKNIPLMIMEPIKGGSLANLSDEVAAPFKKVNKDDSVSRWALRWVASFDNVKVVLSGMSSEDQLKDNLETFCDFKSMTEEEYKAVDEVREILKKRVNNGCTGCRYCMPCPFGVDIPTNFAIWNQFGIYGNVNDTKWHFENDLKETELAKNCAKCGKCEQACPQKISIREDLVKVAECYEGLK